MNLDFSMFNSFQFAMPELIITGISQLDISSFQFFGDLTQDQENNGNQLNFINENEQLTAVYLDLPFFNNTNDKDNLEWATKEYNLWKKEDEMPNGSKSCDTCQYLKKRWKVSQNLSTS